MTCISQHTGVANVAHKWADDDTGGLLHRIRELEDTVQRQNEFIRQLTERVAICSELLAKRAVKCDISAANNESQIG